MPDSRDTLDRIEETALAIRHDVAALRELRAEVDHLRAVLLGDSSSSSEAGIVTRFHLLKLDLEGLRADLDAMRGAGAGRQVEHVRGRWQLVTAVISGLFGLAGTVLSLYLALHKGHL
jgi:hypothetical protein